jgi:hypothetical protein
MSTANLIYEEVKNLPEDLAMEALDFVQFLKTKYQNSEDETTYLLREPANARDLLEAVEELKERKGYQPRELLPDD